MLAILPDNRYQSSSCQAQRRALAKQGAHDARSSVPEWGLFPSSYSDRSARGWRETVISRVEDLLRRAPPLLLRQT